MFVLPEEFCLEFLSHSLRQSIITITLGRGYLRWLTIFMIFL
jgi:hypothetical protein